MNDSLLPVFDQVFVSRGGKLSKEDCKAGRYEWQPHAPLKRGNDQSRVDAGYRESSNNRPPEGQIGADESDSHRCERLHVNEEVQLAR